MRITEIEFIRTFQSIHPVSGLVGEWYAIPGGGVALKATLEKWAQENVVRARFRSWRDSVVEL